MFKRYKIRIIGVTVLVYQLVSFRPNIANYSKSKDIKIPHDSVHTLRVRGGDSPFIVDDTCNIEQSPSVNRLRRYISYLQSQRVLNKLASNIIYKASVSSHGYKPEYKSESYNKKAEVLFRIGVAAAKVGIEDIKDGIKEELKDPEFKQKVLTEIFWIVANWWLADNNKTVDLPNPLDQVQVHESFNSTTSLPKQAGSYLNANKKKGSSIFVEGFVQNNLFNSKKRHYSTLHAAKKRLINSINSNFVNKRRVGRQYTKPNDTRVMGEYQLLTKLKHWLDFYDLATSSEKEILGSQNFTSGEQVTSYVQIMWRFLYNNNTTGKLLNVTFHDEELVNVYYNPETKQIAVFESRFESSGIEQYISAYKLKGKTAFDNLVKHHILGKPHDELANEREQGIERKRAKQALKLLENNKNKWVFETMRDLRPDLLLRNADIRAIKNQINPNPDAILRVAEHEALKRNLTEQYNIILQNEGEEL